MLPRRRKESKRCDNSEFSVFWYFYGCPCIYLCWLTERHTNHPQRVIIPFGMLFVHMHAWEGPKYDSIHLFGICYIVSIPCVTSFSLGTITCGGASHSSRVWALFSGLQTCNKLRGRLAKKI